MSGSSRGEPGMLHGVTEAGIDADSSVDGLSGRVRHLGFRAQVALITIVGFAWRIAYVLIFRRNRLPFLGDSLQYSIGANALAKGQGFINAWAAIGFRREASAAHPPLYMIWLAIPSWLDHGSASQLTHMLWTCVLDVGTIVVVAATARAIAGDGAGIIAALLAAFYPNIWVNDGVLLSEPMAIFTVSLVIWTTYRFVHRPTVPTAVLVGAMCGLAALSRSELLLLSPLLLIPLALFRRGTPFVPRLSWVVAGGLATLIVIAPWVVYNQGRFKERVIFTGNFGTTLAAANCDAVYYGPAIGFKNYDCLHEAAVRSEHPGDDESQRDKALRNQAKIYIKAHLRRVPVVVLARWGRSLEAFRPNDDVKGDEAFGEREPFVSNVAVYSFDAIFALAVAGLFVMRARRIRLLPVLAPIAVVFIAIGATFAQTRYRAPAEVPLVLLAAVALDAIVRAVRRPDAVTPGPVSAPAPELGVPAP